MDTSEKDGREIESGALPSATVQAESTADDDAAVFIPHIQPQLTSAPSFQTGASPCSAVWLCHSELTNKSNASFICASTIDILIVLATESRSCALFNDDELFAVVLESFGAPFVICRCVKGTCGWREREYRKRKQRGR